MSVFERSNNATLKPWYNESDQDEPNQRSKRAYVRRIDMLLEVVLATANPF